MSNKPVRHKPICSFINWPLELKMILWLMTSLRCALCCQWQRSSELDSPAQTETGTKEEMTSSARIITGAKRTREECAQTFGKVQVILRKFYSRISSVCDAHFTTAVTVFQHLAWRPTPANLDKVSSFLSKGHRMSRGLIKALDKVKFIAFQLKEWFRRLKSHLNGHRARH